MSKIALLLISAALVTVSFFARAQVAAPSTVNLQPESTPQSSPIETPTPIPDVPELSVLDEAFKQSSLGKAADESRQRAEIRKLQNQVSTEPSMMAAKKAAERSRTDLQKRDALRDYYNLYYGRMRSLASSDGTRKALDSLKTERLKLLDQPRVRPTGEGTPPPVEKKKEHRSKHSRHS
jgi:hypothetical protein